MKRSDNEYETRWTDVGSGDESIFGKFDLSTPCSAIIRYPVQISGRIW